jgi:hypothetical protein
MNTLKEMQDLLNAAVEQNGGIAKSIEQCDRMYSCEFRTEAFTLGSYFELNDDMDSDDRQYVIDGLFIEMANALYPTKKDAAQKPVYPTFDFEDDEEQYEHIVDATIGHYYDLLECYNEIAVAWFKSAIPDFAIDLNTQVVETCNYKGEGEGDVMLFDTNKHKPIFVSKSHSFYQANQG